MKLIFLEKNIYVDSFHPRGVWPRLEGKPRTPLSSQVATGTSWTKSQKSDCYSVL